MYMVEVANTSPDIFLPDGVAGGHDVVPNFVVEQSRFGSHPYFVQHVRGELVHGERGRSPLDKQRGSQHSGRPGDVHVSVAV